MDKLQPLIKHRFWIIFSLALIFVIVGWWMASGAIAAATDARKKSVDDSFQKAGQNKTEPNAVWVKFAQDKNAIDEKSKANAAKMLWERQQAARTWPASLAADFQKVPFQGEVKQYQTRRKWRRLYKEQIEDLLEIVQPYDPKTKEGLVSVSINSIDHQPFTKWRTQDPVSAEIWTCQEDIWLLKSLLSSIARVNGEATRITEAHVRQINRLSLRGGDPEAKPVAAGGGGMGSMGSMGESAMGGLMGSYGSDSAAGGGMGGMGGASAAYPGKEFEGNAGNDILAEEFGAVAGSGGGMMGSMGGGKGMGSMMMDGGAATGATGTDSAAAEEDRYVDDKEGQYKTRAFLLDVIVRDDQLPNLLASLTNSDFPVEIRRVEVHAGVISSGGAMGGGGADGSGMTMGGGEGMGMGSMGMGSMGGMGGGKGMMGGNDMLGAGMGGGSGMGLSAGDMSAPGDGSLGMQGYGMGGSGMGGLGATSAASDPLAVAMSDQLLLTVKIGGLMTLYQSKDESTAQSETEKAAATEQTNAAPPDPADMGAEEPTETTSGDVPADGTATSEGGAPAGEAAASDVPAVTDTTANPDGTTTDAASEGSAPTTPDANGPDTPTDGSAGSEMPGESPAAGEAPPATSDGATSDSGEPGSPEENPK